MTNGEAYKTLNDREREEFRKVYGDHPLADYIDWDSYYESENGNAMDFVNCLDSYVDEDGNTILVLEEVVEDDMDYYLIFDCDEGSFMKVPA